MKKLSVTSVIAAVTGTLAIGYYILCGILHSFTLSGLWIWLGFGLIMFFGCLWKAFAEPRLRGIKAYRPLKRICLAVFALFVLVFLLFEGFLIAEWIEGYENDGTPPDAVIVLGAAVDGDRPGYALKERIRTAADYIKDHPDVPVIACGGIAAGDRLSEAECIKKELILQDIPEDRIITESESSSTAENLLFSAEHLPNDAKTVAVVTSGFHQFRAGLTAETAFARQRITVIPVSADYNSVLLPYSMVREFAAFVSDLADGNIIL